MKNLLFLFLILVSTFIYGQEELNSKISSENNTAPIPPMITHIESNDSLIFVNWEYFQVNQLDTNILVRISDHDSTTIFQWTSVITTDQYIDRVKSNGTYKYQIITKDSSGNSSKSVIDLVYFHNGKTPTIENIQVFPNDAEKLIKLTWEKPPVGVISYDVYRGKNKQDMELIKSLSPESDRKYVDKDLTQGTTYIYSIQYISVDGIMSTPKYVEVKF